MTHIRFIRIAGATLLAAWLVTPAGAQTQSAAGSAGNSPMPIGIDLGGGPQVDDATKEKRREIEQAYKDATHKIPAQQATSNDPWANMRGDEAKPATKPVARTAQKKKPAQ